MIGRTLANYRVVSQLGAGGMGVVYKAVDVRLDRSVALKVLPAGKTTDADRRARFLQEARSASALNDPHIVTIHDIFVTEDGTDVLVMELIQGRTLRDVISDRPVPEGEALRLMLQVADGVGAAHAAGIVHRDLKPGNIMVTDRGLVKILDFGLAKLTGPIDEQQTMMAPNTLEGTLLGTVDYMSPEQARGEAVDHRSDIFSLGAVLYELLTGVKPFQSPHSIGVLHEILYGQIVPPRERRPEISGDAEAIALRALERDVQRRYQSMDAMASDLRAAQRTLSEGHSSASRSGLAPFVPPALPASASSANTPSFATPSTAATPSGFAAALPPAAVGEIGSSMRALGENLAAVGSKFGRRRRPSVRPPRVRRWGPLPVLLLVGFGMLYARPDARRWVMAQIALLRDSPSSTAPRDAASSALPATAYELTQQGIALLERFDRAGNVDAAISLFERAIQADSDYAPAYAAVARAYFRRAEKTRDKTWTNRAVDSARRAVSLDEHLAESHVSLGWALSAAGDTENATASLRHAIDIDPGNGLAWEALGKIAYDEGRVADAAAAYRKAVELRPKDWRAALGLGNVSYRNGRYDEAVASYRRAVEAAPDASEPHVALAAAYLMLENFSGAAGELQKAISIEPNAAAYTNLGWSFFSDGRYRESAAAFEKGVELQPANPLMWGNLGDAYRWTAGQQARASESYLRATQLLAQQLEHAPNNIRDRSRLALYLAKSGNVTQAREQLQSIDKLESRDVNTIYRAAVTFELAGDRAQALKFLSVALERGYSLREITREPELSALRGDIRFQRLAARFERPFDRRLSSKP
jgi:serine/threonine protein kinase/tetratricopeptide (TPR) repeat protein